MITDIQHCRKPAENAAVNSPAPQAVPDEAAVVRALQASKAEAAAGREMEADQLLARVAQQAPNHPAVLNELGVRMLDRGGLEQAQALFAHAAALNPRQPSIWANLASSLKALGRRSEELEAIEKALELEPRHVSALLQKGAYLEETGDPRNAARTYQNMLECIPPGMEIPANIRAAVDHAKSVVDTDRSALAAQLEEPLAHIRERLGGRRQRRVDMCIDALLGNRRAYHSRPTWMYFPELPAIEFFERADFPWLDAIEAASDGIRGELLRVLVADRDGLQPYLDYPSNLPVDQFRELNHSRRWSAYFLWNQSVEVTGHMARCPTTAKALELAPRCRVAGRAPTAFFSILDPNTRIPPHVGITNTRCTVHLPLVIPPACGFRVGATTREWVPGKAWVFDDTIEHEAWNLSDTPRAILIFDIWNPLLTDVECEMIKVATEVYGKYYSVRDESPL